MNQDIFSPKVELLSLHRHWLHADAIKETMFSKIQLDRSIPYALRKIGIDWSSIFRLEVYYALLYVVIEGYRDLNIEDNKINSLLKETEYIDALRVFRNGIFHYQKDPIPEKVLRFLELKDSEIWIKEINKAFKSYFETELKIKESILRFTKITRKNMVKEARSRFKIFFKHKNKA